MKEKRNYCKMWYLERICKLFILGNYEKKLRI